MEMLVNQTRRAVGAIGLPAGQKLEENHARAVEVATKIEVQPHGLLGAEIARGAQHA